MYDRERIIIMSKLAVYDRDHRDDYKKEQYFRHDYNYKQNTWTRIYVFIGALILVVFYFLHKTAMSGTEFFALDLVSELIGAGIFMVVVQVIYTGIGTIINITEYEKAQNRLVKRRKLERALYRRNASGSSESRRRERGNGRRAVRP